MVLNVHRSHKAYWGREKGNDSCIKVGSDESHFNVSLIVRDKITRQCPQTTFEEKGDQKRIRTEVPLLTVGQTDSLAVNCENGPI